MTSSNRSAGTSYLRRVVTTLVVLAVLVALILWAVSGLLGLGNPWASKREVTPPETSSDAEPFVPEPRTPDLSYEGFDPAFIISDEAFFDSQAYDQEQIESFIVKWNEGCRDGVDGTPCITEFREDSPSFEPDQYCSLGFSGQEADTAASIIWKASQSCGINPQVLLTLIQKEQGLFTASGLRLDESRYNIATGFACPDASVCDPAYFGFATQVYYAARQMRKYEANPYSYMVQPGVPVSIPYAPGEDCEGPVVTVANLATSNLYNYTPYQPNAAALSGSRDACTTWGNQNFYAFFNAWFGTPEKALESAGS
ncbi:hemagglutinin [Actinomycetaceae bacterium MB13-C1-2]|nr:hemagglutinin [Actinomycetaceae bacterium MB13-C1-2]